MKGKYNIFCKWQVLIYDFQSLKLLPCAAVLLYMKIAVQVIALFHPVIDK